MLTYTHTVQQVGSKPIELRVHKDFFNQMYASATAQLCSEIDMTLLAIK